MKLLQSATSPFVRKVLVLLHETGQFEDVEHVEVSTSPLSTDPGVQAANPLGKIPALVRKDAPTIFDSRVICKFFNERAQANFYPELGTWDVLTLEALADGLMEATLLMTLEQRLRAETQQSPEWIEAQWGKVASGLDNVQDRWMSHLNGPMTIAHIGVACALGYIDLRQDDRNWREGRDILATWFADFAARDAMTSTKVSL